MRVDPPLPGCGERIEVRGGHRVADPGILLLINDFH
jgi:hypothetical protein